MKILHIIVGLGIGGAELMLKRLIESQGASSSYEHVVISLTDIGTVGAKLRDRGVHVVALQMKSFAGLPLAFLKLVGEIRKNRPDIVQTWMYHADLVGGLAARLVGIRHVIWGVRTTDVRAGNSGVTIAIMRLCALLSRVIPEKIVCAAEASRRFHAAAGYDAGRMVVVPNGFDTTSLRALAPNRETARRILNLGERDTVIGTVGRFNQAKDHQNFVKAMGLVIERHPELRVIMVGRGLDEANGILRRWTEDTGKQDRFLLLGERSDIPTCLAAMDVFCLSSCSEGFPNVIGEAMSIGIPCVSTNAGDAEILIGDAGFVVPVRDSERLADGLDRMLKLTAPQRQEMGEKSARRIDTEFTMERTQERFQAVYASLTVKGEC
jgi:glycosyltransferase involved in cell wall biosynthesis